MHRTPAPLTYRRVALIPALVLTAASACASTAASASATTLATPPSAPRDVPALAAADTGVVRVSGSAQIEVPADRARLHFALETEARSAAAASQANAEQMNAVLAAARTAVGNAGTIETSGYALSPIYSTPERGGSQTITGYRAQNTLVVTLTDVDRVGAVLDAAVGAGANRVAQLSFFASNPRPARLEAIRQATAQAREEAEVLAAALGRHLGEPLDVAVSGGMQYAEVARFRGADMAMAATPVEPGSQTVTVTVSLSFRLEGMSR